MESENNETVNDDHKTSNVESVDAIKKYIEAQDKELQEQRDSTPSSSIEKNNEDSMDSRVSQSETVSVASSVIDMIISESELEIARKRDMKNKVINTGDKGNSSMALSVGSKVEAKDFGDEWHCAEIIEVDYDEMEVLVHYETDAKKHDEWISVSSPRLRPIGNNAVKPGPSSAESWSSDTVAATSSVKEEIKEEKGEQKVHPMFVVGERCLARWRDNRRFVATIRNDLGNGSYEIIFDDGCHWTCKVSRLYKLRPGKGGVSNGAPNSPATPLPEFGAGPSNATPNMYPAYHTHLFDPTRDYLGSKSERREMKRKLNIKEIFNIGQKRPKTQKIQKEKVEKAPTGKKPSIIRKKPVKIKQEPKVKLEVKTEIPAVDAVASIIGTVNQEIKREAKEEPITQKKIEVKPLNEEVATKDEPKLEVDSDKKEAEEVAPVSEDVDDGEKIEFEDLKPYLDPEVLEEETKLEQFEKPDEGTHEEVIDRIKEAINKLEGGLNQAEQTSSPKPEVKPEVKLEVKPNVKPKTSELDGTEDKVEHIPPIPEVKPPETGRAKKKETKKLSKIKKGKKLRLLREKKVKKQVEKVKSELEEMKKQVEEMRKQMLKSQELAKEGDMSAKFMLPGEWCCKWVNGQPVGTVSEIECEIKHDSTGKIPLPRRSVQVEDTRLPEGWTKHMVRRSLGHSAGKWDVVLVSPDNRRFHTKNEMRVYLENNPDKSLHAYENALTDFGVHLKLARRMGWISHTPDGMVDGPVNQLPVGTLSSTSPLVKRRSLGLKKKGIKVKNKIPKVTIKMKPPQNILPPEEEAVPTQVTATCTSMSAVDSNLEQLNAPPLEDGYVYVGSLKVQIIETLLRCPADGCFKNFRNTTLLQMHIKHYHRELRKMMGATPKVLDLAYARTMPVEAETPRVKDDQKVIKVKIPRLPKPKPEREEAKIEIKADRIEPIQIDIAAITPVKSGEIPIPRSQDSPKLRQILINKPVKRPRVLLPVRRVDPQPSEQMIPDSLNEDFDFEPNESLEPTLDIPSMEHLDFETAISTHTVTRPLHEKKRKPKKKALVLHPKGIMSEEEDWFAVNSDFDTRSSFPRSGTPDSKVDLKAAAVSSESNEERRERASNTYIYNENGQRIKIVHMKREEIINCHCGFREEDGLMVQCELCLCWQHAICLNIQRQEDVPDKYTCSMCLNPIRGRRSARFTHDQDRLYEGLLPGAPPCAALRRSHELAGNLLRVDDALHALRVKYYVATKKDHPKLYLWAKDWEQAEIEYTQEKLNSDYSDLNIMISSIGKENLPIKPEDVKDMPLDIRTSPSLDNDNERYSQRDIPLGSQSLLSGLLSSPGGASLDLPISTSELERLAKSVQEQECQRATIVAPQPEAAIENGACRERLLKHIQRCQALIDSRLDSIEAQVAELESQNPSFQDDETAEFMPRTKQTIQMLMRDLDTMEELGVIT